jgi:hypothetical protein
MDWDCTSCVDCRFWWGKDDDFGQCRRNAPTPISYVSEDKHVDSLDNEQIYVSWPKVCSDQSCGEFVRAK